MIDRRTFIGSVMGGILATPLAAEAQQAREVRIGVLSSASPSLDPTRGQSDGADKYLPFHMSRVAH